MDSRYPCNACRDCQLTCCSARRSFVCALRSRSKFQVPPQR